MSVPISNVTRRVVYAPSGTGPYAFTFEILTATDIEVYKGDTLLVLTTNYTVTINPNGTGSVTLVLTAGTDNITIIGARAIQRTSDFVTGGDFFANTVNNELDSLTIFAQQNAEGLARALTAPETDPTTINMTLPRAADRANKYLAFDVNGNPEPGDTAIEVAAVAAIAAQIVAVAAIDSEIVAVEAIDADITTVAGIAANVITVAGVAANVTTVAGISADVISVAGDATDIGAVAAVASDVAALGPIAADITTVAGVDSDVTAVAAIDSDVTTVAGIAANVTTVAGISADVTTVAADGTDIGTVAGVSSGINTLAPIAANITTVAGISADVTAVAGDATDIGTVASNIANVNTVAGISADVTSVAGDATDIGAVAGIAANVTTVAGIAANVTTVAGISANVTTVAGISTDVTTVATNVADITNFSDVYLGPAATDPATRNDSSALQAGDLYFNTASDVVKVYDGAAWVAAFVSGSGFVDLTSAQTITGVKTFDNGLNTDTISEETSAAGVTVDGVLLKDSQVSTDQINEKTSAAGVTIDGVLLKDSEVTTDVIKEKTSATGVTVDSVLLKDGMVVTDSSMNFRNRIINGDMRIDQRNAGAAVTASGAYPVDRFLVFNSSDGAFSAQRSTTAPSGFTNSLQFTTTTIDSSLANGQNVGIIQSIEGFNTADLAFGAAGAKMVTLSFWVRSSLTGTFGGSLRNSAADRSYPFTYTISVADTFEYKTVEIEGDTSGTWLTNNGIGISLLFGLGSASSESGTAGSWAGANYVSATGAVSVIGTLNATWFVTGVQLEVGSVATPFERRPFGTELSLCQRYLPAFRYDTNPTALPTQLQYNSATAGRGMIAFPVSARTSPTGSVVSSASHFTYYESDGGTRTGSAIALAIGGLNGAVIDANVASGATTNGCYTLTITNSAGYIYFTGCEL